MDMLETADQQQKLSKNTEYTGVRGFWGNAKNQRLCATLLWV